MVVCLGNHTQSILAMSVRCKAEGWGWLGTEGFSRANSQGVTVCPTLPWHNPTLAHQL